MADDSLFHLVKPRAETQVLFGAFVAKCRRAAGLSINEFAVAANFAFDPCSTGAECAETFSCCQICVQPLSCPRRTTTWLSEIERGSTCPTPNGLATLTLGFKLAGPAGLKALANEYKDLQRGLHSAYRAFDTDVYGLPARRLRAEFNLSVPSFRDSPARQASGLLPVLNEIPYSYRQLTLLPLALLALVVAGTLWSEPWEKGATNRLPTTSLGNALPYAILVVVCFAFILHAVSEKLDCIAEKLRFGNPKTVFQRLRIARHLEFQGQYAEVEGSKRWFEPLEAAYLMPRNRKYVLDFGLECDLLDRLIPALFLATVFEAGWVIKARQVGVKGWWGWAVAAALLLLAALLLHRVRGEICRKLEKQWLGGVAKLDLPHSVSDPRATKTTDSAQVNPS
jgi:hypothetical protein